MFNDILGFQQRDLQSSWKDYLEQLERAQQMQMQTNTYAQWQRQFNQASTPKYKRFILLTKPRGINK